MGGFDSTHDTDEDAGAVYNSPLHKKRAGPPSLRGPGPRRAPLVGLRMGGRVADEDPRAPTPPPAGQAGSAGVGSEYETESEVQILRRALAASEEKNAQLTVRVAELSAALAAAHMSSAQQQCAVADHIAELGALQERCEAWAELQVDDMDTPPAQPDVIPPPQQQVTKALRGAPRPLVLQLPLHVDEGDCDADLSPRTRGAFLLPWSPRAQGAEVALPSSPRTLAAALALPPSPRLLAAAVALPDSPRSQGLSSPRPGGAGSGWAASEGASLATACAWSPPESPRLGAAEAEPPRGAGRGVVASAAVRLWRLLQPRR
eukprot:TRINITY_DN20356_c0_g3_i3.p2 TRINITY_DN20356_c0_g3~~TRINITY_DN20356_c0_g3_i3.p2  ORF type:complete len:364 (+),score=87.42 TRINITY_DN20356_c0_g3_i3:141-1094(+)